MDTISPHFSYKEAGRSPQPKHIRKLVANCLSPDRGLEGAQDNLLMIPEVRIFENVWDG